MIHLLSHIDFVSLFIQVFELLVLLFDISAYQKQANFWNLSSYRFYDKSYRWLPGFDPWSGSVSPKHPIHSPVASLGRCFILCSSEPYFQMGPNTLRVPMELHKEARENLSRSLRDAAEDYTVNSYMYFQGGRNNQRFDTDQNYVIFRQVNYFIENGLVFTMVLLHYTSKFPFLLRLHTTLCTSMTMNDRTIMSKWNRSNFCWHHEHVKCKCLSRNQNLQTCMQNADR